MCVTIYFNNADKLVNILFSKIFSATNNVRISNYKTLLNFGKLLLNTFFLKLSDIGKCYQLFSNYLINC